MGAPASGKTVEVTGIVLYGLEDQKTVQYLGSFDTLGSMREAGAICV